MGDRPTTALWGVGDAAVITQNTLQLPHECGTVAP